MIDNNNQDKPSGGYLLEIEEAEELIKELSKRHNVPVPVVKQVELLTMRETKITKKGTRTTITDTTYTVNGAFVFNKKTGECWIEFYGKPSRHVVIHEFKHYLEYLGVKYITF